jgi:hypothetical protein
MYATVNLLSGTVIAVTPAPTNIGSIFACVALGEGQNPAYGWSASEAEGVWSFAAPAIPLATLAAQTLTAASQAAASIVAQIMPDAAHQAAFQNAASILNGLGGAAPSVDPLKTKFANLAAAYGVSGSAFATLVIAMQGASLDLGTASATLADSVAAATSSAQLAAALAAFETAIGAVVAEISAASPPVAIVASGAITIAGVNA